MVASAEGKQRKNGLNSVLAAPVGAPLWANHFNAIGYSRKGLLVLDVIVKVPSHAAHQNLDNSIYKAIPVIEWFKLQFRKNFKVLGPVKMTVTQLTPENNTM
jgi:acetylornithine deacetylase